MKRFIICLAIISLSVAGFLFINNSSDKTSADTPTETSAPQTSYQTISPEQAKSLISEIPTPIILDVRTPEEFAASHLENAILVPHTEVKTYAQTNLPDKSTPIFLYCHSGTRSALAAQDLTDLNYTSISNLAGGLLAWPYDTIAE